MSGIIILEEIMDDILDKREGQGAVFGIRDYLNFEGLPHDFLFHYSPNVPYDSLKPTDKIIAPVLNYSYPQQVERAKSYMLGLNSGKPFLDRFLMRQTTEKRKIKKETHNQMHHPGGYIRFFSVVETPTGTEVEQTMNYIGISEQELFNHLPEIERVKIGKAKEQIESILRRRAQ